MCTIATACKYIYCELTRRSDASRLRRVEVREQPKVDQFNDSRFARDDDIFGLHVPVGETTRVQPVNGPEHLEEKPRGQRLGQAAMVLVQEVKQVGPANQLPHHYDAGATARDDIQQLDDIRVGRDAADEHHFLAQLVDRNRHARLAPAPADRFQGNLAPALSVLRPVHDRRAPAIDLVEDAVAPPDQLPGEQKRRGVVGEVVQ